MNLMMPRKVFEWVAGLIMAMVCFPFAALFIENLTPAIAWICIWICVFGICVGLNTGLEWKGLFFLSASLILATLGVAYCEKVSPQDLWAVKMLANMMQTLGNGLGTTLIATGLLGREWFLAK